MYKQRRRTYYNPTSPSGHHSQRRPPEHYTDGWHKEEFGSKVGCQNTGHMKDGDPIDSYQELSLRNISFDNQQSYHRPTRTHWDGGQVPLPVDHFTRLRLNDVNRTAEVQTSRKASLKDEPESAKDPSPARSGPGTCIRFANPDQPILDKRLRVQGKLPVVRRA